MDSNNSLLDLKTKICCICVKSRESTFDLNDYDTPVNKSITLLQKLEFVTKAKEKIKQTAFICNYCKVELSIAYRFLKKVAKSEHILALMAPEKNCIDVDDDDSFIEEYLLSEFDDTEEPYSHNDFINCESIEFLDNNGDLGVTDDPLSDICHSTTNNEDMDNTEETNCYSKALQNLPKLSSTPRLVQSTARCEVISDIIEDNMDRDKSESRDNSKASFQNPRIKRSSLESRIPMFVIPTRTSNTSNILHICKYCDRSFEKASSLKRHITNLHYDQSADEFVYVKSDTSIPCKYCSRIFKREFTLRRHLNAFHADEADIDELEDYNMFGSNQETNKRSLCPICGRIVPKATIALHIRRHTKENPYECYNCNKGFQRRQELDIHIRKHTGDKPYACVICKKSFPSDSKLSLHMHLHSDKNFWECSYSQKKYRCPGGNATQAKENEEPSSDTNK